MVLRSTLTMVSTNGSRIKSPGPLGPPRTRPSRKMTPRSYSLTTLMALIKTPATKMTIITKTMAEKPKAAACNKPKIACIEDIKDPPLVLVHRVEGPTSRRPFDGHHLHHRSVGETHHRNLTSCLYHRLLTSWAGLLRGERQHCSPPLAVHEHPSIRLQPHRAFHDAHLADHPFPAGDGRPPAEGARRAQNPEEHAPHEYSDHREGAEQHP